MEYQRYGFFDLYYPGSFWNFRRFADRRLKTLHVIGFYNAAVLAFLTVYKNALHADNPILAILVCSVSFSIALVGFAVEIPGLSHHFEKLGTILKRENHCGQRPHGYQSHRRLGGKLPVHRSGITFYVLLMFLWICLFFMYLGNLEHL